MSTRRRRRSPGRARTRRCRGSRTGRSAGSSTTRRNSPRARCGAAGATTASCSTRRNSAAGRRARSGTSSATCRRCCASAASCLKPGGFLILTAYAIRASFLSMHRLSRGGARAGRRVGRAGAPGARRRAARHLALLALDCAMSERPAAHRELQEGHEPRQPAGEGHPRAAAEEASRRERAVPRRGPEARARRGGGRLADPHARLRRGAGRRRARSARSRRETKAAGGAVLEVSAQVLEKITRRDNPQNVIGVFRQRFAPEADDRPRGHLGRARPRARPRQSRHDHPHRRRGRHCRAWRWSAPPATRSALEAVRATMGSIFHVPLARTGEDGLIAQARRHGARLVGTHLTAATIDYRAGRLPAAADPAHGQRAAGVDGEAGGRLRRAGAHPDARQGGFAQPRRLDRADDLRGAARRLRCGLYSSARSK